MATTLSYKSTSNQHFDYAADPMNTVTLNHEQFSASSTKKANQGSKNDKTDGSSSGPGASSNSTTNQMNSSSAKNKSDSHAGQSCQQQSSIISNANLAYPFLQTQFLGQYFQGTSNPNNQAPSSSYYQSNSGNTPSVSNSSNNANVSSNNRRGGKKKAPQTQQQQQEFRAFYNLRKKDVNNNVCGQQQMYKPKNCAFISEWFKRLTPEERVNSLTTIYPHLTETIIHMNKRIEQNGWHSFALKDSTGYDQKQISPYSQTNSSAYSSSYATASHFLSSSTSSTSSFEEKFYCREQNEIEMRTIKSNEKDKVNAEQEIIKHVRLTDYDRYLDTFSVSLELVQDPDHFFQLMSHASGNQAFSSPCSFQFDQKAQVNIIEQPWWFKPKSFNSFATWIVVAIEETLWTHYNYALNQNLGTAKVNELVQLFKEKSESAGQDVSFETLAQFWKQINPLSKKQLLDQLRDKAQKIPKNNAFDSITKARSTILQRSMQSKEMGYHLKIVDFGNKNADQDSQSHQNDEQEYQDLELKQIIDLSALPGKELEMIEFLTNSPLNRSEKRQDQICREFLKLIKQTYQDNLVEILLKEENQNKTASKPSKKKKKATCNVVQPQQTIIQEQVVEEIKPAEDQTVSKKKKKNKKQNGISTHNDTTQNIMTIPPTNTNTTSASQSAIKKKKSVPQNNQIQLNEKLEIINVNSSKDHYSCDESTIQEPIMASKGSKKEISQKFLVDSCKSTLENQSNTGSTDSIKTSEISQNKLVQLTASRSVDIKTNTARGQKQTSKTASKNTTLPYKSPRQNAFSSEEEYIKKRTYTNLVSDSQTLKIAKKEELEIKKQLTELLSSLIDQVCIKFQASTVSKPSSKAISNNCETNQFSPEFYKLGANQIDEQNQYDLYSQRKNSYKKKNHKNSNIQEGLNNTYVRKSSINKKLKEEKKFSEDLYDKTLEKVTPVQLTNDNNKNLQNKSIVEQQQKDKQSKYYYKKHKNYEEKGSQIETVNKELSQFKKEINHHDLQQPNKAISSTNDQQFNKQQRKKSPTASMRNDDTMSQLSYGQISETAPTENQDASDAVGQNNRKKRNRKKGKMNDQQIINNFMKNLQTNHEEVELEAKKAKPLAKQELAPHQKKNNNYQAQQKHQPITQHDESKHQNSMGYKQKAAPLSSQSKPQSHTNLNNDQQYNKNQKKQKPQNQLYQKQVFQQKPSSVQNQQVSNKIQPIQLSQNIQKQPIVQLQTINNKSLEVEQVAVKLPTNNPETLVSLSSQCFGENGLFKFQESQNALLAVNNNMLPHQSPFKYLNFNKVQEEDIATGIESQGEKSITKADIQFVHAAEESKMTPQKELIESTGQISHIQEYSVQKPLTQNLKDHKQGEYAQKQFQSQRYQYLGEDLVPPLVQSPFSSLSTQAQSFTPKGYNKFAFGSQNTTINKRNNLQGSGLDDVNKAEYNQSQGSPHKLNNDQSINSHYPKPTYANQHNYNHTQSLIYGANQNPQGNFIINQTNIGQSGIIQSHPENQNYSTPPQVIKKTSSTSLQSQGTNANQKRQNNGQQHNYAQNNNGGGNNKHHQKNQVNQRQPGKLHQHQSQIQFPSHNNVIEHQSQIQNYPNHQYYQKSPVANTSHQSSYFDFQIQNQDYQYQFQGLNPIASSIPQMPYSPQLNTQYASPLNEVADINAPIGNAHYDQHQDLLMHLFNSFNNPNNILGPLRDGFQSPPPIIDFQPSFDQNYPKTPSQMDQGVYQNLESAFFHKLDQNIYSYVNQLKQKIDVLKTERDFIFERISQAIQQIYQGQTPKLLLFGSLSTGLALESSDMDLAVTGLQLIDKYAMIQQMQKLADELQKWGFVESFKYIDTASVPVIKMKVNLHKLREQEMKEVEEGDFQKRLISEENSLLSLDITFDDNQPSAVSQLPGANQYPFMGDVYAGQGQQKTHLGIQSCALVKYYTNNYPHLKEVAILLKQFMTIHSLNSPYYGGISAYSTILILVAYMNYFGLRNSPFMSPSRLLVGFLEFYGNYFNPSSLGISVVNDASFYQLIGLPDANIVILDPLNLQNNTTRNSYLTKGILQKFQAAFNSLKNLILNPPQAQQVSTMQNYSAEIVIQHNEIYLQPATYPAVHSFSGNQLESQNLLPLNIEVELKDNGSEQKQHQQQITEEQPYDVITGEQAVASGASQDSRYLYFDIDLLEVFFAKDILSLNDAAAKEPLMTKQVYQNAPYGKVTPAF